MTKGSFVMSKKNIYVDFHVLQTVPPSCVNRDDTGSPKTAVYGGTVRARVSSQSWKHAMREMFRNEIFDEYQVGNRTKRIVAMVEEELRELGCAADAEKKAIEALENAGVKIKDAEKGSDALFFMSKAQAKALAQLVFDGCKDKKEYKNALNSAPSVDMALFGRMVASDPSLNYDAAAQVAHSISTHTVHNEYDYFTAVDDCAPEDKAGAGHLGTVEYNSATLYRYATVNVNELAASLGKAAASDAVRGFAEAFIRSMPTGKQNTFANRTLPDAIYVTIRRDQPVNLCGAFEKPVYTSVGGYAEPSEKALADYAERVYKDYVNEPEAAFAVGGGMEKLAETMPLRELLDRVKDKVSECLEGEM